MRSATCLAAVLMFGSAPYVAPGQEAPPPQPAQAQPAPAQPAPPPEAQPPEPPPPPPAVQPVPAQPGRPVPGWTGQRRARVMLPPGGRQLNPYGQPPPQQHQRWREVAVFHGPHGRPVKGAFLGVGVSPAQAALGRQLQLPQGIGLVVDAVEPGSPAEQAGLKEFDVLHRINDQLLVNPEQFTVLVRTFKPGDEVTLTVVREGKPQELTARLGERELMPLGRSDVQINLYGDLLGATPAPNVPGEVPAPPPPPAAVFGGADDDRIRLIAPGGDQINAASIVFEDNQHKLSISAPGGRKHLRAEDKSGKIIFDGPIDSAEDLGKVPTDVRDKIVKMGIQGLNLPAAPPPAAPAPAPQPAPTSPQPPQQQSQPQLTPPPPGGAAAQL
jgi:hypothetical protein